MSSCYRGNQNGEYGSANPGEATKICPTDLTSTTFEWRRPIGGDKASQGNDACDSNGGRDSARCRPMDTTECSKLCPSEAKYMCEIHRQNQPVRPSQSQGTCMWAGSRSCDLVGGDCSQPTLSLRGLAPTDPVGRAGSPFESKSADNCQLNVSSSYESDKLARLRNRIRSSLINSQSSVDDGLCIATERTRKNRQSLSSIGNQPTQEATSFSDGIHISLIEAERERLAWDIINREVSEWHNVCQTGRPSWWLPTSKCTDSRMRHLNPILLPLVPLPALPIVDPDGLLKLAQRGHQRSVTEGCLTTSDDIHDLVQLVAVQLLGSCFTLPEDYIASFEHSARIRDHKSTPYGLPDPEMISSLKMHTNHRYAPSFGYDATNTSPTQFWQESYDASSPLSSSGQHSDLRKSKARLCEDYSRRRRVYRPLQVSENSAPDSQSSHSGAEEKCDLVRQRRRGFKRSKVRFSFSDIPDKNLAIGSQAAEAIGRRPLVRNNTSSLLERGRRNDEPNVPQDDFTQRHSSRYVLRPVIRSEPHPVFIQPVKELVVKQWHNIRRRIGQSFTRGCPDPSGTSAEFEYQNSERSISPGSRQLRSGGKYRRREARERHDIDSDIGEGSPRYDSLALSGETEAESTEYAAGVPRPPPFKHVDSLSLFHGVEASKADSNDMVTGSAELTAPGGTNLRKPSGVNLGSRTESGFFSTAVKAKQQQANTPSFRPRRQSVRCQRKSMLSEMCTADEDDNLSLAATPNGVILSAPKEAPVSEDVIDLPVSAGDVPHLLLEHALSTKSQVSSSDPHGIHGLTTAPPLRPRIERTSTSGTQVFRPCESGVEVDGVPMGPGGGIWDEVNQENGVCQMRERTYL